MVIGLLSGKDETSRTMQYWLMPRGQILEYSRQEKTARAFVSQLCWRGWGGGGGGVVVQSTTKTVRS